MSKEKRTNPIDVRVPGHTIARERFDATIVLALIESQWYSNLLHVFDNPFRDPYLAASTLQREAICQREDLAQAIDYCESAGPMTS